MQVFDFTADITLENHRALLRPLVTTDIENLIHFSENEPSIWKYSLLQAAGRKNLENYISAAAKGRFEKIAYPFIVFDKLKGEYAGSTRFYDIQLANQSLQLGFTWYGSDFQ
ncbi:MAG: GNAT family N-acetyltransferase, partial [Bacteroidia bacterium]